MQSSSNISKNTSAMDAETLKFRLKKNYKAIIRDLEPRKVLSYLYQEDVFDEDDMEEVRSERTRKRQAETLLSLLKRGDEKGYRVLFEALEECQPHLADVLQEPIISENAPRSVTIGKYFQNEDNDELITPSSHLTKLEEKIQSLNLRGPAEHDYEIPDTLNIQPTSLDFISRLYRPEYLDVVYKMTSSPRGYAVIINYQKFKPNPKYTYELLEDREGSESDAASLEKLFKGLNFEVESLKDLTLEGTTSKIEALRNRKELGRYDCFVLCLMSHGKEDYIYTSDGGQVKITSFRNSFRSGDCPSLAGKPKLFFIQACRGEKKDFGIKIVKDGPPSPSENQEEAPPPLETKRSFQFDTPSLQVDKGPSTADMADFLLAYSSVDGHASFRNTFVGSRFIRCMIEVFTQFAGVEDVMSMLTRVINKVNSMGELGHKQVPQPETTLTKKVFFWPGLSFDNI